MAHYYLGALLVAKEASMYALARNVPYNTTIQIEDEHHHVTEAMPATHNGEHEYDADHWDAVLLDHGWQRTEPWRGVPEGYTAAIREVQFLRVDVGAQWWRLRDASGDDVGEGPFSVEEDDVEWEAQADMVIGDKRLERTSDWTDKNGYRTCTVIAL